MTEERMRCPQSLSTPTSLSRAGYGGTRERCQEVALSPPRPQQARLVASHPPTNADPRAPHDSRGQR